MKSIRLTLCGLLGSLCGSLLFSCTSENAVAEEQEEINSSGGVSRFITTPSEQSVNFNIKYDVNGDYRVVFDVYSENPFEVTSEGFIKKNLQPVISGMTDKDGAYNIARIISNGVKEVYVTSDALGVPALLHGIIENGSVTPQEVDLNQLVGEQKEDIASRATSVSYLGSWNSWGRPDYIDSNKECEITNEELKSISAALPEWVSVKDEYVKSDFLYVKEAAEVWVSLLSAKSLFNNALGYYCYTDGMDKESIAEVIALPRTNISWFSTSGLKYGEYVKLKYLNPVTNQLEDKFPAGSKIGWVLHRSGFSCWSSKVSQGTYQFYTNKEWNPEETKKNHTAIFTTNEGNVILGFEDMYNEAFLADNDCNDVIFHVASSPATAIVAEAEIPEVPEGDEVEEEVDAVQPLSSVVTVSADDALMNNLHVASKSVLNVVDGNVVGVNDVLYIATADVMEDMVTRTYTTDEQTRKVVVRTTVKFARASEEESSEETKRVVVRTTVKNTTWDADLQSRGLGEYGTVEELILAVVEGYSEHLAAGEVLKIEITMELEGVNYEDFITSIPVSPYSPFIVHCESAE